MNAVSPRVTDADAAAAVSAANAMVGDVVLTYGKDSWTIPAATVKSLITFTTDAASGKPSPTVTGTAATVKGNRPTDESAGRSAYLLFRLGSSVLRCVCKQRDDTGPLEGDSQLALVAGAGAGLSSRLDLGPLGQVAAESVDFLVVDRDRLVGAKRADLATSSIAVHVVSLGPGLLSGIGRWHLS